MSITKQDLLEALSHVEDPEFGTDIVALKRIKDIGIEGNRVVLTLLLTTPAHPHKRQLQDQCIQAVKQLGAVEVDVVLDTSVHPAPLFGKQSIPGIRNILAVASGKGGVGKSSIAVNLAVALAQSGANTGLLDCDFYGPSVPAMTGIHQKVAADQNKRIIPHQAFGVKIMSMGFLIERHQALSWRGPMLHKMLNQFFFQVNWAPLDYLILDLPPGTGDVQLTLTQSVPLSAAILVTTPQEVAVRDVEKGMEMFQQCNVPVLGIVENMSWLEKNGTIYRPFGQGGGQKVAGDYNIPLLAELPLDPSIPSELGEGLPVTVREDTGALGDRFRLLAGRIAVALGRLTQQWAAPGPGAMEV